MSDKNPSTVWVYQQQIDRLKDMKQRYNEANEDMAYYQIIDNMYNEITNGGES